MSKSFKIQYDKAHDLKSLVVLHHRGKVQRLQVLKNINLDIKKGDTVGLVGANGCGKSTLLKLMTKIYYPDKGTIDVNGKLTSIIELGAGFHPDFTGRENIYFNASIFGLTRKQIDARLDQIIEFSELGNFIDEPIRTYSSGMYMRLAFSVAINVDAEILLIDEILAVGDQHFQDKCFAKLHELKKSDKTIVFVSHSLDAVKDLCNRAIWIYNGEFRLDGDPTYVIDEYLKQMAIDHKEQHKKDIASGKKKAKGTIFVDSPKDFKHIDMRSPEVKLQGWKLADMDEAKFTIKIGEEELKDIRYYPRPDVLNVFDDYRGLVDEDTVGFSTVIDLSKYVKYADDKNEVHIHLSEDMPDGTQIAFKEITLGLDNLEKEEN
jgi:ABC-type polysaccharide/polyol phosphate transport system ATPase subunit